MNNKLLLIFCLALLKLPVQGQFVSKPLNFPDTSFSVVTYSIVDANTAWFGADQVFWSTWTWSSFPWVIHTTDGGGTFRFDSIPMSGKIGIQEVSAIDSSICYYAVTDDDVIFKIWKTTDGGSTWLDMTTTQYTNGFMDFVHAFSADTVLTVGDPNNGYWEIYRSVDGGTTWLRIPSANIPAELAYEGSNWQYHAECGDTVWVATSRGRCYRSIDQGQNWTVSTPLGGGAGNYCNVKFSTSLNGVCFQPGSANRVARSYDGGTSWTPVIVPLGLIPFSASPVAGFPEGFIFSSPTSDPAVYDIYFTPDLFSSVMMISPAIATQGFLSFKDSQTGWLSGAGTQNDNIYKFNSILDEIKNIASAGDVLGIYPNPGTLTSLVKLPCTISGSKGVLRVYSTIGSLLYEKDTDSSQTWTALPANEFTNNAYLVEFTDELGQHFTQRWVVQH